MTWFAFQNDGSVYELNGYAEKQLVSTFAHGYATQAQAIAHKNAPATAAQAAMLAQYQAAARSPAGGGAYGVIQIVNVNAAGKQTGTVNPPGPLGAAKDALGALTNINEFLSRLTSVNTWIRVGEFVLGAMLILAGALKLSGSSGDLGDIAKMAVKVVK